MILFRNRETKNGIVCDTINVNDGEQLKAANKAGFHTIKELNEIDNIQDAELVDSEDSKATESSKNEEVDSYADLNKTQLKLILDEKEIEYNSRDTRNELIDKLKGIV